MNNEIQRLLNLNDEALGRFMENKGLDSTPKELLEFKKMLNRLSHYDDADLITFLFDCGL